MVLFLNPLTFRYNRPLLPPILWESDCDLWRLTLPNIIVRATLARERPPAGILIPILGSSIKGPTVRLGYIGA